jgi:hypothetical protein
VRVDKEANSLVATIQFYHATQLRPGSPGASGAPRSQEEIHRNRCRGVEHGFSEAGRWQAMCDPATRRARLMGTDGVTPHFYLAADSNTVLYP